MKPNTHLVSIDHARECIQVYNIICVIIIVITTHNAVTSIVYLYGPLSRISSSCSTKSMRVPGACDPPTSMMHALISLG